MEKIVYAIVKTEPGAVSGTDLLTDIEGLSGMLLCLVTYKTIGAVVSDFNSGVTATEKATVMSYAAIIEKLSKRTVLLPVRFGTLFRSDEMVKELLIHHYDLLSNNLDNVENKDEYGLKILWDYERGVERIKQKTESEKLNVGNYFSRQTPHTGYLIEKIKQHRIEEAILKEAEQIIGLISTELACVAPQSRFKKMVSAQILLEGIFLVERNRKGEFISAIEKIKQHHPDLHFLMTGPWPPYSFAGTITSETVAT